jgi:hypothetical protein
MFWRSAFQSPAKAASSAALVAAATFAFSAPLQGRSHMGRTIAYEGDLTECGARLLSSLSG